MICKAEIKKGVHYRRDFPQSDDEMTFIETNDTAVVSFINDDGSIIGNSIEYGYKSEDEIRSIISGHRELDLRYCYVDTTFDLCELQSIHAGYALFNSNVSFDSVTFNGDVDFQYAKFVGTSGFLCIEFCGVVNFCGVKFYKTVLFSNATFRSKTDFTSAEFSGRAMFDDVTFTNEVSFKYSSFNAEANFQGTRFSGDVNFIETIFNSHIDCSKARFYRNATFHYTKFSGVSEFANSTFYGVADFSNSVFISRAGFLGATFKDEVIFILSSFYGNTTFYGTAFNRAVDVLDSEFRDKTNFSRATFEESIMFGGVTFNGDLDFRNAIVKNSIQFKSVKFLSYVDLQLEECNELNIADCRFEKTCTVTCCHNFSSLAIQNCMTIAPFSLPFDDNLKNAILKGLRTDPEMDTDLRGDDSKNKNNKKYEAFAQQFNFLKVCYNRNGEYDKEDRAYVEYRRCLRKSKRKSFSRGLNWIFLDISSLYCTNPYRVFGVAIIAIVFFASLYFIPGIVSFQPTDSPICNSVFFQQLWNTLYHSIITFFTIGYGNSIPSGWIGLILTGLEGFIGVFLMSLFTVSFVRKVLR